MFYYWMQRTTSVVQVDAVRRFEEYKRDCENTIKLTFVEIHSRLEFCAGACVTQVDVNGNDVAVGTVWCATSPSSLRNEVWVVPKTGSTFTIGLPIHFKTKQGVEITNPDLPNMLNPPTLHEISGINHTIGAEQRETLAHMKMTAERGGQWGGNTYVGKSALLDCRAMNYEPDPDQENDRCPLPGGYPNLWANAKDKGILGANDYLKKHHFLRALINARGIRAGHPALDGLTTADLNTGSISQCVTVLKRSDQMAAASLGGNVALHEYNMVFQHMPTLTQSREAKKRIAEEEALGKWFLFVLCIFFVASWA